MTNEKYRVEPEYGVYKNQQRTNQTQQPESQRQQRLLFGFGI
jgi:hypothetical protein